MLRQFLLYIIIIAALPASLLPAQRNPTPQALLKSGPMVGYSEMREVMLWVQTTRACQAYIEYQEAGKPNSPWLLTNAVQTQASNAFTAHLLASDVQPGKDYIGVLRLDGKKVPLPYPIRFHARDLWQWRTDPPAFKAVVGSCAYFNDSTSDRPGKPYGSDYEIFDAIHKESANLMLWLGDNIYLNESDWNTKTGIQYRYTHGRSYRVLQPLLASMSHYAIWDDHDYGPNDADRSFVHKDLTQQAFQDFWANPSYGVNGQGGITTMFSWSDCDFFLMDDRSFRSPNGLTTSEREMLGKAQIDWLIDALKGSMAPFKFVCVGGMVLSTADVYENYIHVAPQERKRLLDAIQAEGITGVIFLTGDRHHTEMSRWKPEGGYPVYDLCASPFTSGTYPGDNGANTLLMPNTEYVGHNYATLEVSGPRTDRKLRITCHDKSGAPVWTQEITATEMKAK